ncbi:MAG: 50S ribosomal protein L29 [Phycisphaerales bacterium]|jgi:large subunit ribosomal protein L29|nr:50S ribosomal protein L29 [Phycisphaerales bacterium]
MKAQEVHKFSNEEVSVEIARLRKRMFELRTQKVTDKIEDTSQFKKTRRDIARLMTEQRSRDMSKSEAQS